MVYIGSPFTVVPEDVVQVTTVMPGEGPGDVTILVRAARCFHPEGPPILSITVSGAPFKIRPGEYAGLGVATRGGRRVAAVRILDKKEEVQLGCL